MTAAEKPLTFTAVDDLAFAAANDLLNKKDSGLRFTPLTLGPLFELCHLGVGRRLKKTVVQDWIVVNGAEPMIDALHGGQESWISPDRRRMGFIRSERKGPDGDLRLSGFLMDAQRAARDITQLPGNTPGQLAAAMEELEGNIHEHSMAIASGVLAFRAAQNMFEFVISDQGIGMLRSLQRSADYAALHDHGKAMEEALKDGTSRFGNDGGRGYGFRSIFVGLANLRGALRFRSGDHALLMDGTSPNLTTARLAQKAFIDGFYASVTILFGAE